MKYEAAAAVVELKKAFQNPDITRFYHLFIHYQAFPETIGQGKQ
jgi:hypothetical protein